MTWRKIVAALFAAIALIPAHGIIAPRPNDFHRHLKRNIGKFVFGVGAFLGGGGGLIGGGGIGGGGGSSSGAFGGGRSGGDFPGAY